MFSLSMDDERQSNASKRQSQQQARSKTPVSFADHASMDRRSKGSKKSVEQQQQQQQGPPPPPPAKPVRSGSVEITSLHDEDDDDEEVQDDEAEEEKEKEVLVRQQRQQEQVMAKKPVIAVPSKPSLDAAQRLSKPSLFSASSSSSFQQPQAKASLPFGTMSAQQRLEEMRRLAAKKAGVSMGAPAHVKQPSSTLFSMPKARPQSAPTNSALQLLLARKQAMEAGNVGGRGELVCISSSLPEAVRFISRHVHAERTNITP